MMNKKGVEQGLIWIFYIVIIAIATLFVLDKIQGKAERTAIGEEFIARDIALLLNTMYASPNDIEVEYTISATREPEFDILIGRLNEVGVKTLDSEHGYGIILEGETGFSWYKFQPYGEFKFVRLEKPKKILFSKDEGGINVKKLA